MKKLYSKHTAYKICMLWQIKSHTNATCSNLISKFSVGHHYDKYNVTSIWWLVEHWTFPRITITLIWRNYSRLQHLIFFAFLFFFLRLLMPCWLFFLWHDWRWRFGEVSFVIFTVFTKLLRSCCCKFVFTLICASAVDILMFLFNSYPNNN